VVANARELLAATLRPIDMEYCLSAGDGAATMWERGPDLDLDGDGLLDAASLDLDGDGLADDALADLDGDGIAEHAVLDLGDGGDGGDVGDGRDVSGSGERYFTDDGTGTWAIAAERPARQPTGLRWFGLDGVEHTGKPLAGFDTEGRDEVRLLDSDGNGLADRAITSGASGVTGYVDTDGDGRWDVKLTDTDGDGAADAASALAPKT
jgi:hypothetical protein